MKMRMGLDTKQRTNAMDEDLCQLLLSTLYRTYIYSTYLYICMLNVWLMNRPSNSRTLAFYLAIRPTHICTIYDFSLLPTLPIYLLYIYMYIFFVCVCARAMAAVSSLISLNFTNCQLCALVNIFTSFGLASNSWLTGPGFFFFFFFEAGSALGHGPGWFPFSRASLYVHVRQFLLYCSRSCIYCLECQFVSCAHCSALMGQGRAIRELSLYLKF